MGVRANQTGVTLEFYDINGNPTGEPSVNGEFAFFFSRRRPVDPTNPDPALGSKDWLTDLFVFDNPVKLRGMTPTQSGIQLTSAASQQVLVHWNTADGSQTRTECFTISSSSSNAPTINDKLYADTVKVMPKGTVMDPKTNNLWKEWVAAVQSFMTQATNPAATTAVQRVKPRSPKGKP